MTGVLCCFKSMEMSFINKISNFFFCRPLWHHSWIITWMRLILDFLAWDQIEFGLACFYNIRLSKDSSDQSNRGFCNRAPGPLDTFICLCSCISLLSRLIKKIFLSFSEVKPFKNNFCLLLSHVSFLVVFCFVLYFGSVFFVSLFSCQKFPIFVSCISVFCFLLSAYVYKLWFILFRQIVSCCAHHRVPTELVQCKAQVWSMYSWLWHSLQYNGTQWLIPHACFFFVKSAPKVCSIYSISYLNNSMSAWRKVRKLLWWLIAVSSFSSMLPNTYRRDTAMEKDLYRLYLT